MTRLEDWPERLRAELERASSEPFAFGSHDCATWVGRAIEAITGEDPTAPYHGRYETEIGWKRLINAELGGSLEAGWTILLGDPVAPAFASRGDVVMVEHDGAKACGLVDLSGERVACVGLDGLEYLPLSSAYTAWKV